MPARVRPRFYNPHVPNDPYRALSDVLGAIARTGLDVQTQHWVTVAIRAMLDTPGLTFDEALGLRPARGKRNTLHQKNKLSLLRVLGATMHGSPGERAKQIAAVLRGEIAPPDPLAATCLEQLRTHYSVPHSARQILRVLTDSET